MKEREMGGARSLHGKMRSLKRRDHSKDLRRRWEDNIKMDVREIWFRVVDWVHKARDRNWWRALVNTVTNLQVP
jgi:hypothetical protein